MKLKWANGGVKRLGFTCPLQLHKTNNQFRLLSSYELCEWQRVSKAASRLLRVLLRKSHFLIARILAWHPTVLFHQRLLTGVDVTFWYSRMFKYI